MERLARLSSVLRVERRSATFSSAAPSVLAVQSATWLADTKPSRSTSAWTACFFGIGLFLCAFLALPPTKVSFAFQNLALAAERASTGVGLHCLTNALAHEPSRLIGGETAHALDLLGRDTLLARCHQVEHQRPLGERAVAAFHDAIDAHGELVPAVVDVIAVRP